MILTTSLFPWQEEAVKKLLPIRIGALYMEMGLGKTRTVLEMIKIRLDRGKIDAVLWLCPCSVRENLKQDILRHSTDALPKIAVYGIESLSSSIRIYDLLVRFVTSRRVMLIVDESNLVKNFKAIRTQRITSLSTKCPYRMILNGTPISRNEADLFAQWYLLDWRVLGYRSFWSFAANHLEYDDKFKHMVRRVLNVDYLTDKISPYTYSVKKDDVLKLPDKLYSRRYFSLTDEQAEHYFEQMDAYLNTLIDLDDSAAIYRTFTVLQEITSGRRITSKVEDPLSHEPLFSPDENPRIQILLDIVAESDEKTIIWCKFQHEIDDISKVLSDLYGQDNVQVFCGRISQAKRNEAISNFRTSSRFLIANKSCAGYGLNLQFCCRAIYYDNDWTLATRLQSEDRIHRIGQSNAVNIIDIYADKTIDLRILICLDRKENLAESFKKNIKSKEVRAWLCGMEEGSDDKTWTGRK